MKRMLPRVAALLPLLWWSAAGALGLGEIDVHSRLNQRFSASIPLTSLAPDEISEVRAGLASVADFQRAGIERSEFLSGLQFNVAQAPQPRIEIASQRIVREPYLDLLLEVRGSRGRILRQYTVLLDPPEVAERRAQRSVPNAAATSPANTSAAAVAASPSRSSTNPTSTPASPAAAAPQPSAVASARPAPQPAAQAASERYGPVRAGETFWSIATRLRPNATLTMDQVLLALYRANPDAFSGGINGLQRGATLVVPDAATMAATPADRARVEISQLRAAAARSATAVSAAPTRTAPPAIEVAPAPLPSATTAASDADTATAQDADATVPPVPSDAAAVDADDAAVDDDPAAGTQIDTDSTVDAVEDVAGADAVATDSQTSETPDVAAAPVQPAEPRAATQRPVPPAEPAPAASGWIDALLLPLAVLLLLLLAGYAAWRWLKSRRERERERGEGDYTRRRSSPRVPAAPVAGAAVAATAAQPEPTIAGARESTGADALSADAAAAVVPPADITQVFDTPPAQEPPPAEVDFDLTGQFEAQTVQINLDADDPVAEADFHLAYGLYDEAALLLRQAAAAQPSRTDIQVKLAETYFAAGNTAAFQEVAASLENRVSAADWQKITIMRQQLQPPVAAGGGDVATPSSPELDAPAVSAEDSKLDFAFDDTPAPVDTAEPAPLPRDADGFLDFKLEDLELPSLGETTPPPPAPSSSAGTVEFDLSGFDLDVGDAAAAAPAQGAGATLAFDDGLPPPTAATPPVPPAAPADFATLDLDSFDLDALDEDSNAISGDEAGTKLDLARAYLDMGDDEMARTLLDEVMTQGSEQQREDARGLLGRLGAP